MLVDEDRLVVRREERGERREAERREQGVLDRAPVRTRRFGEGGQDQFDSESGAYFVIIKYTP